MYNLYHDANGWDSYRCWVYDQANSSHLLLTWDPALVAPTVTTRWAAVSLMCRRYSRTATASRQTTLEFIPRTYQTVWPGDNRPGSRVASGVESYSRRRTVWWTVSYIRIH